MLERGKNESETQKRESEGYKPARTGGLRREEGREAFVMMLSHGLSLSSHSVSLSPEQRFVIIAYLRYKKPIHLIPI